MLKLWFGILERAKDNYSIINIRIGLVQDNCNGIYIADRFTN